MKSSDPTGPARLFASWRSECPEKCRWDADGFLEPPTHAFDFQQLFDNPCTIVVAPPWLGKSFVARAIDGYLRQAGGRLNSELSFGEYCHLTLLDEHRSGAPLEPPWWPSWVKEEESMGCWIVDALDEAEEHEKGLLRSFFGQLERLPSEQRSRLRLLLLGRGAEIPAEVFEKIEEIYAQDHRKVELLPLDRRTADEILGVEDLERTLALMHRCGLRHLARYPAILELLNKQPSDRDFSWCDSSCC